MAETLTPKAPGAVARYPWRPRLDAGDYLATLTPVVTSGTVAIPRSGIEGGKAFFFVSGGDDGETAVVTATATTTSGSTLVETFYVPVRATTIALNRTVADVLQYALRPIVGVRGSASAAELEDARENMDDMLASWAVRGANLGVKLPVDPSDVLSVPDGYISAIKSNLRVRICELYGQPVSSVDVLNARTGLILIIHDNLPEDRAGVYF